MAKILSNVGIVTGRPVEAHHVSQSVNALTAAEAYDVSISGSLVVNGITYPIFDGVSGSVLTTNGAGVATFVENNAVTASYISSSNVDGPHGFDSVLTSSYALTSSISDFATDASASLLSTRALTADSAESASYALTASYVENINSEKFCFTNQTTVPVVHGIGSESVVVQAYQENPITGLLELTLPDNIVIDSVNQVTVTFAVPTTGCITVSGGGFLRSGSIRFAQSASYVAQTQRTLTQGTGIQAFSFNGSADAQVAFDDTYVVPSASYALTASHALNVPDVAETASYILSSNVDGPFGMDSVQSASYALTASYVDGFAPYRLDFVNQLNLTVTHNLDSTSLTVQVYRNDATTSFVPTLMIPARVQHANLNQTSLGFSAPTTGYVVITRGGFIRSGLAESASYALTASYALNAAGADIDTGSFVLTSSITDLTQSFTRGDGSTYINLLPTSSVTASYALTASYIDQIFTERFDFTNIGTVDLAHTLNTEDIFIQVYEADGVDYRQIIPDDVFIINANLARVIFAANTTGYAVVTKGGIVQAGNVQNAVTASYVNNTYKQDVTGGTTYAITHNLGEEFPVVQAYELTTRAQELPASIISAGPQAVTVTFGAIFTGTIIVKK